MRRCLPLLAALLVSSCGEAPPETLRAAASFGSALQKSSEILIDDPISVEAPEGHFENRIASNGTEFLLVWDTQPGGPSSVVSERISSSGSVLDPVPQMLSDPSLVSLFGDAASDGSQFLVVWLTLQSAVWQLRGAHLGADGTLLDPPGGFLISLNVSSAFGPSVTYGGGNYLVTWTAGIASALDIQGAFVSPSGTSITSIPISVVGSDQFAPRAAFSGSTFMVVWQDNRNGLPPNIYGTPVTALGVVQSPSGIQIATNGQAPAIAGDGTNFLATWTDGRNTTKDIYGTRLDSAGTILDPGGAPISAVAGDQTGPAVAFNGTNYAVIWSDARRGSPIDVYAVPITTAGVVQTEFSVTLGTSAAQFPLLVTAGAEFFAGWGDLRNDLVTAALYGARISESGVVLDPQGISLINSANTEQNPSACFDGTHFRVIWSDNRSRQQTEIYGTAVGIGGDIPTRTAQPVAVGPPDFRQAPTVACAPGLSLAAWQELGIRATRIDSTGLALDQPPVVVTTDTSAANPVVARSGDEFLVVWESGITNESVIAARIDSTGTVLDPLGLIISSTGRNEYTPSVAGNDSGWLVTWWDQNGVDTVQVASVQPNGDVGGPIPVAAGTTQINPTVTTDGDNWWVAWTETNLLRWVKINRTFVPVGPVGSLSVVGAVGPRFAFDGAHPVLAWQQPQGADLGNIYAMRLDDTGNVLDSPPLSIATSSDTEGLRGLASDNQGRTLIVYERLDTHAPFLSPRARAQLLTDLPLSQACVQDSECGSGFCADGVCCNSACGGASNDCMACSLAAGAAVDGTCGPVSAGVACDDGVACSLQPVCDGTQLTCPICTTPEEPPHVGTKHLAVGCGCTATRADGSGVWAWFGLWSLLAIERRAQGSTGRKSSRPT